MTQDNDKYTKWINTFLLSIVTIVMTLGIGHISDLNKNVRDLNVKIAVIIERQEMGRERLEKVEDKIEEFPSWVDDNYEKKK